MILNSKNLKNMKTAYIVKGYRTAVGKAPKGLFRFKRTDELAAETIQHMMKEIPQLDVKRIDDVIVGKYKLEWQNVLLQVVQRA